MGRGGGGGGGGHSFGGGSHSRSFGGTSSHSSRGGSSSHRSSSSYRSSYSGPRVTHHYHHYGPSYGVHYGGGGGWFASVMTALIILFMVFIIFTAIAGSSGNVTKSTVEREPLKPYASFDKGAIDDQAGWIHNKKTLQKGMESFYKETGVQPALVICEDINGEKYLPDSEVQAFMEEEYDDLIGNERGLLVLFCEYADSDWYMYYMAGTDAQTVMDDEACGILMDYTHSLYTDSSLSDEEFFAGIFRKTGERIMTTTPTVASKIPVIVGGLVVVAAMVIGLKALKAKHKRDAEKAAETERILNTPIDRI